MKLAAIDTGSNTLRLLVGRVVKGKVIPEFYLRRVCRLAADFSEEVGLSMAAKERTLFALQELAAACRESEVCQIRAVGTAAFRQAVNGEDFARQINTATHLPIEIISGDMEARYMATGVLSALDPMPGHALIIDIGGGSTEFVLCAQQEAIWSQSLQLGVVRLTEGYQSAEERQTFIETAVTKLICDLVSICEANGINPAELSLVGTAGTVTTLAALDMQMADYDWQRVNNYSLSRSRLHYWATELAPLSPAQRERLPGMDVGRGDLILSGLEILLCVLDKMHIISITVSDFGILEGLLLSMHNIEERESIR